MERYVYDPYGKVTVLSGETGATDWTEVTGNVSAYGNDILYCGYYFEWETGMYEVRNRYYNPGLGRWVTWDPRGYIEGAGLYQYASSGPASRVDPSGLSGGGPNWPNNSVGDEMQADKEKSGTRDAPIKCCSEWRKMWQVDGFPTLMDCTWAEYVKRDPMGALGVRATADAEAVTSGAAAAAGEVAEGLGKIGAARALRMLSIKVVGGGLIYEGLTMLHEFPEAVDYCDSEVCVKTVPPIQKVRNRKWYNPAWLVWGYTYSCYDCPPGTDAIGSPAPGERIVRPSSDPGKPSR